MLKMLEMLEEKQISKRMRVIVKVVDRVTAIVRVRDSVRVTDRVKVRV